MLIHINNATTITSRNTEQISSGRAETGWFMSKVIDQDDDLVVR